MQKNAADPEQDRPDDPKTDDGKAYSAAELERRHLVCSGRWTEGHEGQQMADSGYQRQAAFRQPDFDADTCGNGYLIARELRFSAVCGASIWLRGARQSG